MTETKASQIPHHHNLRVDYLALAGSIDNPAQSKKRSARRSLRTKVALGLASLSAVASLSYWGSRPGDPAAYDTPPTYTEESLETRALWGRPDNRCYVVSQQRLRRIADQKPSHSGICEGGFESIYGLMTLTVPVKGRNRNPAINAPSELVKDLYEEIAPLDQLLPRSKRVRDFYFAVLDPRIPPMSNLQYNAHVNDGDINYLMPMEYQIFSSDELAISAFHEESHLFHQAFDPAISGNSLSNWPSQFTFDLAEKYFKPMHKIATARRFSGPRSLFALIDESTYHAFGGGHPHDNELELYASTMTVLHYYPAPFMARVDALQPQDNVLLRGLASHVAESVRPFAKTQAQFDRVFDPRLQSWLGTAPIR